MPRARNTRRSRGRRGGRGRISEGWKTAFLILGIIAIAAPALLVWMNRPADVEANEETLCPTDPEMIPHLHVILLERNRRTWIETGEFAPLDRTTAQQIQRMLVDELDGLDQYAKVQVFEVTYDRDKLYEPVIEACNPGDADSVNPLYRNPRRAQQRYDTAFRQPLEELIAARSNWDPDYQFSLKDSLDALARSAFGVLRHATKSVTIVSDFIVPQNFGRSSFQGVGPGWRLTPNLPDTPDWRVDFSNAAVRMLYVREKYVRIPDIQGPAHLQWWEKYFADRNATVTEVDHVGSPDS